MQLNPWCLLQYISKLKDTKRVNDWNILRGKQTNHVSLNRQIYILRSE